MMRVRKADRRPGAATVEFAVLLPFLLFLGVIATDWARLLYYTITLESCARNGALYASDAEIAAKSPYANVTQAALAEAPSLDGVATVTTAPATDSTGAAAVVCTVTRPFQTFANFPGVPRTQTLSRSVQMRMASLLIAAPPSPTATTSP
jgi:Flp pilus assembly protein TadG